MVAIEAHTSEYLDVAGYNELIWSCARIGDVAGAEMWFSQMAAAGFKDLNHISAWRYWLDQMRFQGFEAAFHRCSWSSDLTGAELWFQEMHHGCQPHAFSSCEMGRTTDAFLGVPTGPAAVEFTPDNCSPLHSSTAYGALIKACAHRGEVARVEGLLSGMVKEGHEPTTATYNSVIHACTQTGNLAKAERYLEVMERGEGAPCPDVITYNSVINACAAQGEAAQAEALLLRMMARGLAPNEVTYGTICKALARQGEVAAVERIMSALEESGTPLNEYFYASLISACGAAHPVDPVRAERAFAELESRGLRAQSVKRVLASVVGERRAAELMQAAGERRAADLAGPATNLIERKVECVKETGRSFRSAGRHRGGRRGRAAGA
jgi:pentatricopeptide repeat protein